MASGESEKPTLLSYFEEHYRFLTYQNEHHLVTVAAKWLAETLGKPEEFGNMPAVKFVLPQGIGDSVWALLKIKSIAAGRKKLWIKRFAPMGRSNVSPPYARRPDCVRPWRLRSRWPPPHSHPLKAARRLFPIS